jgi:hypothetical protein
MPGYTLPAGSVSLLLMTAAVTLALLGGRQQTTASADPWWRVLGAPLATLGVAGMLVTAYFGVLSVLLDMGDKASCFG